MCRHRAQSIALLSLRDLLQLAASGARPLALADREHDLDRGRQQRRALERLRRLAHRATDRGGSGAGFSLGRPQQRQTRLRLKATTTRLPVGVLGGAELSPQAMDLTHSVVGLAVGELIEHSLGEPFGGPPRILQSVLPCAAKLHDLGAMDQA